MGSRPSCVLPTLVTHVPRAQPCLTSIVWLHSQVWLHLTSCSLALNTLVHITTDQSDGKSNEGIRLVGQSFLDGSFRITSAKEVLV